ncbi:MAG: type III pantothenate kinase [Nitrospirae bacterium]|nr:MAG: type III pantothenate kinase [Nitrospirota bacterium]
MKGRLCVDIGNTTIKIGFFISDELRTASLKTDLKSGREDIKSALQELIKNEPTEGAIISSVVTELTEAIVDAIEEFTGLRPILLDYRTDTGLRINLNKPETLGPDRIANAVAAYELYRENVLVVDFGTATTTTVVTEEAELIGGHIMPGVETMLKSLSERTSRLPGLEPERPSLPLGRDTKSSIMSGVIYGTAGAVRRLRDEVEREIGSCSVVITGGMAWVVRDFLDFPYTLVPMLTLKGLNKILDRSIS